MYFSLIAVEQKAYSIKEQVLDFKNGNVSHTRKRV
jgi:site-specific DNA-cytosine methylase